MWYKVISKLNFTSFTAVACCFIYITAEIILEAVKVLGGRTESSNVLWSAKNLRDAESSVDPAGTSYMAVKWETSDRRHIHFLSVSEVCILAWPLMALSRCDPAVSAGEHHHHFLFSKQPIIDRVRSIETPADTVTGCRSKAFRRVPPAEVTSGFSL